MNLVTTAAISIGVVSSVNYAQELPSHPTGGGTPLAESASKGAPRESVVIENEPAFVFNENNANFIKAILNTAITYISNERNGKWLFNNPFPDNTLEESYQKHELVLKLHPGYEVNIVLIQNSSNEWTLESFVPISTSFAENGPYRNSLYLPMIRSTDLSLALNPNRTNIFILSDFMPSGLESVVPLDSSISAFPITNQSVATWYRYSDSSGVGIQKTNRNYVLNIYLYVPTKGYTLAELDPNTLTLSIDGDTNLSDKESTAFFGTIMDSIIGKKSNIEEQ